MSDAQQGTPSGNDGGGGQPGDAFGAFEAALIKAAQARPPSTADPAVSAAFALGWHMSELYDQEHPPPAKRDPPNLPGLSSLTGAQRMGILTDQIEVGVGKLADPIAKAKLDAIDLSGLKGLTIGQAGQDPVLTAHVQLLGELTAADFRLGKAYGLGRALADSCPDGAAAAVAAAELNPFRIANLLRWLDDLGTAFPPHAASSVARSLAMWRDAFHPQADPPPAGKLDRARAWRQKRRAGAAGPINLTNAAGALGRQGELWRALLSGEKNGTDMLEIDNYLDAASDLVSRMAVVVRGAIVRMPVLATSVLALVGVGVGLLFAGSSSQLVGGATSILAALGLTWKGFGGTLGKLVGRLETPLWGAVLDDAIADAITLLGESPTTRRRRQVALALSKGPAPEN